MEEIKPGDVVTLKSDESAVFTVGYVSKTNKSAVIHWFDYANKEMKAKEVPLSILKK